MITDTMLALYDIERERFMERGEELLMYETFLHVTDHIPLKIVEQMLTITSLGELWMFLADMRTRYAEVLNARKAARNWIAAHTDGEGD